VAGLSILNFILPWTLQRNENPRQANVTMVSTGEPGERQFLSRPVSGLSFMPDADMLCA
jgi:hypothetical protein